MQTQQSALGPIAIPAAGQRVAGHFTFAGDEGLTKYQWPYFTILGEVSGPTMLVTAGIHAAEYTGIEAAIRLGRDTDPAHVRGILIVIPLLNRPGFLRAQRLRESRRRRQPESPIPR